MFIVWREDSTAVHPPKGASAGVDQGWGVGAKHRLTLLTKSIQFEEHTM